MPSVNTASLRIDLLDPRATLPKYAYPEDSGIDVFPLSFFWLNPGERKLIKTGIALGIPHGHEIQIRPRSGLALREGITVLNSPATIDQGYIGEVGVILVNHGDKIFEGNPKVAIAQLVLAPVTRAQIELAPRNSFSQTERGEGAYGSSDQL